MNLKKYRILQKRRDMYAKLTAINAIPEPPGPGPDPPVPPEPPTPGQFNPWLSNPGNAYLCMGYWINRTFTGGYSKIPDRLMWGQYPPPVWQPELPYGSTLPNCTGWAYGRVLYCMNTTVSTAVPVYGDAGEWFGSTTWPCSQTPSLCAIMCWSGGKGHVAIVEAINYDSSGNWTSVVVSEAGYSNGYYNGNWWNFGGVQNTVVYRNRPNRFGMIWQGFINTPAGLIVR